MKGLAPAMAKGGHAARRNADHESRSSTPENAVLALQRHAGNHAVGRLIAARGSARPLPPLFRREMEARLGTDLQSVRIHDDAEANRQAASLGAQAVTVGDDIVFGEGRFVPDTMAGRQLIGHELAHMVQQRRGGAMTPRIDGRGPLEAEAGRVAGALATGGGPVSVSGASAVGPAAQPANDKSHAPEGPPMIVRIDAYWGSKSAIATLSNGSKVPLALTKNVLEPGEADYKFEYGAESGPEDSPITELVSETSASGPILWRPPSNYALSPKVRVSVKLPPKENAQRRIDRLPKFIQDYLYHDVGGGDLEYLADYGESLAKAGATKASLAPVEVQGKAPPDPEFEFVEAARKGRYSQFSSFDQFKKDLERKVSAAKEQDRRTGLTPPDSFRRSGMARQSACGPGEMEPVRVRRI